MEFCSRSEEETIAFGRKFAERIGNSALIKLVGDLGSGKTTLTKGLALGLGISELVVSPTYVFLKSYRARDTILFHLDLYRSPVELDPRRVNLKELMRDNPKAIFVVEWAQFIGSLNASRLTFRVDLSSPSVWERRIKITEEK